MSFRICYPLTHEANLPLRRRRLDWIRVLTREWQVDFRASMTRVTRQALTVKLRCRRPRAELREERWLAVNKSYFSIEMSLATLLDRFAFLVARGIFSHPPKSPTQLIVGNYTLLCISQILYTGHQNLFQRVKSDLQFQTTSSKLHKSFFTPYWQEILRWTARPQLAQVNLSLLHPVVKLHMKTYYRHPLK